MASKDLQSSDPKKQEELEDITTCCICTEVYTDPKALPCIHTFCMKCIQEHGLKTRKGPGDEMPCPICRRLFKVPPEGFPGLPKHFFIERLIQVSKFSDPAAVTKVLCSVCLEECKEQTGTEIPTADKYCAECKHNLCKECCSEHRKFKATKNHKLIEINDHVVGQNVKTNLAPGVCELHRQRVLDVYCVDCKTVVCAICFIEKHINHKGSDVEELVDSFRKQIERNVEATNKCRSEAETKKAEILKVKENIKKTVENLEWDVANRKDELKQFADEHAASLLQGICLIRQSKLKEIQMATDDVDTYISNLETYNSYCQKIMAEGSASDICSAISDLAVSAAELQRQCTPMIEREIQSFNIRFRKSELEEFLKESSDNLIGEIEEEGDSRTKKRSKQSQLEELSEEIDRLRKENEIERTDKENLRLANEELRSNVNKEVQANKTLSEELSKEKGNNDAQIKKLKENVEKLRQELESTQALTGREKQAFAEDLYHFSRESYVIVDQKTGSVAYDPIGVKDNFVSTVMAKMPFSKECPYFEIEIVNWGQIGAITVGAVPKDFRIGRQPGWDPQSYGYHADDGCLFVDGSTRGESTSKGCKTGDKMGCGVEFKDNKIKTVYFTKNGKRVHTYSSNVANPPGGLFPTVGLHSLGEKARLVSKDPWKRL